MTIHETFRVTDHVLSTLQMELPWLLQSGFVAHEEIQERLRTLREVNHEVDQMAKRINPGGFGRFAAAGGSANRPSDN